MTLDRLAEKYLDRHSQIRSPRTVQTLRERLARPRAAFGQFPLVELEAMSGELADWRGTLPPR